MNEKGQQGELFTGGLTFTTPAFTVILANLTPDSLTGIGAGSEQIFVDKFKTFRQQENYQYNAGTKNSMMLWTFYGKMQNDDLKAIFAHLRTLKPVKNKIEKLRGEMVANN